MAKVPDEKGPVEESTSNEGSNASGRGLMQKFSTLKVGSKRCQIFLAS